VVRPRSVAWSEALDSKYEHSPWSMALFSKEVALRVNEPPIDTGTAAGRALLDVLGKQAA